MGSYGSGISTPWKAGKQTRRYLVYSSNRNLADCLAGAGTGEIYRNIRITPDIDKKKLYVEALVNDASSANRIVVTVKEGGQVVASAQSINNLPVEITMPENMKLWSPDSPNLYDLEITLWNGAKEVDKVKSYAAMRKYSIERDDKGIVRLQLNNKDQFQFGPLDQGWWPDGLYTAPTDEALEYDIIKTKDFGFNMIRKHVKVEPARWYTHCDRHGIIVWQDMPSGDRGPGWNSQDYLRVPRVCVQQSPKPITGKSGKRSSIISILILRLGFGFPLTRHGDNLKPKKLLNGPNNMTHRVWLIPPVGVTIIQWVICLICTIIRTLSVSL